LWALVEKFNGEGLDDCLEDYDKDNKRLKEWICEVKLHKDIEL